MDVLTTKVLGETVGAEVVDLDADRLLRDDALPEACLDALDAHGVLLFRQLHLDDAAQIAFAKRLGKVVVVPSHPIPEITEWHIDGSMDEIPSKASLLSAHVLAQSGGDTEFASTYAAYDDLTNDEQERFSSYRVVHSFEAAQRRIYPDPAPEQVADWHTRPVKLHPLVWHHQTGRSSLVLGSSASHVQGMDREEGRALLAGLEARATGPGRVFRHEWSVGDLVIWDNRGVMHRACHYDSTSQREMHRTTLLGDEAIGSSASLRFAGDPRVS
jgi:alpha-ketoglutarate-dependent taurine dioxygenase